MQKHCPQTIERGWPSIRWFLRWNLAVTCLLRVYAEHCSRLQVQDGLLVSHYHYGYAMLALVQLRKRQSNG